MNTSDSFPLIAKEGRPFLAVTIAASLLVWYLAGAWWSLPLWLFTLFTLQFFRDPPRCAPMGAQLVIAPADGRVVAVERCRDPYCERDAVKISIFMNVFNVHSSRSPVVGEVKQRWYNAGKFLNAALSKASVENERNALWIRTPEGNDVTCVQVAGLIARRILCYVDKGAILSLGQRYGFIRFGSRLDVYLPLSATVKVSIGDRPRAGETIIAAL